MQQDEIALKKAVDSGDTDLGICYFIMSSISRYASYQKEIARC